MRKWADFPREKSHNLSKPKPLFGGAARLGNVYHIDTGLVFAELDGRPGASITFADMSFQTATLSAPRVSGNARLLEDTTESAFGDYVTPRP